MQNFYEKEEGILGEAIRDSYFSFQEKEKCVVAVVENIIPVLEKTFVEKLAENWQKFSGVRVDFVFVPKKEGEGESFNSAQRKEQQKQRELLEQQAFQQINLEGIMKIFPGVPKLVEEKE